MSQFKEYSLFESLLLAASGKCVILNRHDVRSAPRQSDVVNLLRRECRQFLLEMISANIIFIRECGTALASGKMCIRLFHCLPISGTIINTV